MQNEVYILPFLLLFSTLKVIKNTLNREKGIKLPLILLSLLIKIEK